MNTLAEIAAIYVFMYAGLVNVVNPPLPEWLQYGSFGLCCVMVLYLMWYIRDMGKIIREKDEKYIELLERDIQSRNRLSEALEDRPCIAKDQRAGNPK